MTIFNETPLPNYPFAQLLGAKIEILKPGHSRVTLLINDDMVNFHGITH
ncbi:hypothetical protein [uncultured Desulfobacter sp.]|nr:hypothetical protein [uncultured Desulfobacter sp.]